jgi:hypothetical protein
MGKELEAGFPKSEAWGLCRFQVTNRLTSSVPTSRALKSRPPPRRCFQAGRASTPYAHVSPPQRSEEPEVGDELCRCVDELSRCHQCFCRLIQGCLLSGIERVFQFVAPAAQATESSQSRAELRPDDFLDRVATARGGRTQALLRQESDAGLRRGLQAARVIAETAPDMSRQSYPPGLPAIVVCGGALQPSATRATPAAASVNRGLRGQDVRL